MGHGVKGYRASFQLAAGGGVSIHGRRGDIGVDFVHHRLKVLDCAVQMLGEREVARHWIEKGGREEWHQKIVALLMSSQSQQFGWYPSIIGIKR